MQRALRRHGPWLCALALGGILAQGMVKYAAPAPRWDMAVWTVFLAVTALVVWRVRRDSGSAGREVRSSRWHYGQPLMVLAGVWAAAAVAVFLAAGASELTPKVQRILEADPVIRSSQVTEVTKVSGHDGDRRPDELSYTVHHIVRFDSGTETVESTFRSFEKVSPGSTVWVLYVPGKPDLGGHTEESKDQLEALRGGPADTFWTVVTAGNLGFAGLLALVGLFGTNKPVRDGSRGTLRSAAAAAGRTGVARHRPPERQNNNTDSSERPEKSGPYVELSLQDGAAVRLFVHRSIEPKALAQQLGEATGTLYWDARPPNRGADSTWALFVLDSGEEIPGVVQRSDSFTWQTAGVQVDAGDTRPLERRPVVHPLTWQPGVQSAAVPFLAAAVGGLLAYAYFGSAIALGVAWVMLPLAVFAVLLFRGMRLDEAVTEPPSVDLDKAR